MSEKKTNSGLKAQGTMNKTRGTLNGITITKNQIIRSTGVIRKRVRTSKK